jgi:hypothetical protein
MRCFCACRASCISGQAVAASACRGRAAAFARGEGARHRLRLRCATPRGPSASGRQAQADSLAGQTQQRSRSSATHARGRRAAHSTSAGRASPVLLLLHPRRCHLLLRPSSDCTSLRLASLASPLLHAGRSPLARALVRPSCTSHSHTLRAPIQAQARLDLLLSPDLASWLSC